MVAALADFLPDVQPHCDSVPVPVAERAILHTIREFCEKSGYWREEQVFETVTDETAPGQYTLTYTAGSELVSVANPIQHSGLPVWLQDEDFLTEWSDSWRTDTGEKARYYIMPSKNVVQLVPYPLTAEVDGLRVIKILRPSLTAPIVDDSILSEWSEGISYGAISRLKAMPSKPWTDREAVMRYREAFEECYEEAESMALASKQSRRFQRTRTVSSRYF